MTAFLVVALALVCGASAAKFEPSVAFVCDRGAMHMHEDGKWVSDPSTDCMEGKNEILQYCKKSYPALEVTNIVESSDEKHIKGWCSLNKTDCDNTEAFTVRPFRCLTGPFQSDALIVSKGCTFDHVHQPKQCHGFDWWRDVAEKACSGVKHMKTESFAMLLPCGTDVFTGVEYVCCPKDASAPTTEEKPAKVEVEKPVISVGVMSGKKPVKLAGDQEVKVVDNYLHMKAVAYEANEHDAFTLAKKAQVKVNHDRIAKLMTDWAEARKRVLHLKEIDPKGAEKMNKEITPRFQKEYFALQSTSDSKVLQLDAVHQQHVQANLDGKKRKVIEKLMHELQEDQPEPAAITKLLKRYISIEEKDAHHCVHHYTKIRDRNAAQGREVLPATLTHLTLISARINQSIDLLNTLDSDSMKEKILKEVNDWRSKTFNNINTYISTFKAELAAHPSATKPPRVSSSKKPLKVIDPKPVIHIHESKHVDEPVTKPVEPVSKPEMKVGTPAKGMYQKYADKFAVKAAGIKPAHVDEEDEKEDEHAYRKLMSPKVQVNSLAKGAAAVESNKFSSHPASPAGVSAGAGIAIGIGAVAAVMIVVFSVALIKKKLQGDKPSKDKYVGVAADEAMSAEDRHIASMQNGYENPTYRYLEKQGA